MGSTSTARTFAVLFVLALVAAPSCGTGGPPPRHARAADGGTRTAGQDLAEVPDSDGLWVAPASRDFRQNPRLLKRVLATPHGYFRFIATSFSESVCERFRDDLVALPTVNLHGDAHIEQYAVTDLGRGLTDFDYSAAGPAILDLMRITTSMRLAALQLHFPDRGDALLEAFFSGFRAALDDPEVVAPEPAWARRTRGTFRDDRPRYLAWAESLMRPVDELSRARLVNDAQPYFDAMVAEHTELPAGFFRLVSLGRLQMGIGSALDEKYLLRVRGQTDAPEDDVFLEAKELRDLSGISCLRDFRPGDPLRIMVGQARIANAPFPYLGHIDHDGRVLWVHGWGDHYVEIVIDDGQTTDELVEIARDIGVQLGRGHPKEIAPQLDRELRTAMGTMLDRLRPRIESLSLQMAGEIVADWERFRREAAALAPAPATSPPAP